MEEERPWANELTPICDDLVRRDSSSLFWPAEARELERRLRHSLKQTNSLRLKLLCVQAGQSGLGPGTRRLRLSKNGSGPGILKTTEDSK